MTTTTSPSPNSSGFSWKVRHSAWLLAVVLGAGYLSFVGFVYCAVRVRERKWVVVAALSVAATIVGYVILGATSDAAYLVELWLASIVFGVVVDVDYLAWRAKGADSPETPGTSGTSGRARKTRIALLERQLLGVVSSGDEVSMAQLGPCAAELRTLANAARTRRILSTTFAAAVRRAISDDILSSGEETWLNSVANALGIQPALELGRQPALQEEVAVARINDGRIGVLSSPQMVLQGGEQAYGEFRVSLMKEVTQREWRGASSGFSVPIGFGIRYRTGAVRGHSVVVGTQFVAEDAGVLTVTSLRTVYAGQRKTLEFKHEKLVSLQQFTDGLRLGVSNRQAAALFRFTHGSPTIAAALISYATAHRAH